MEFQELFKLLLRKKYYLIIVPMISAAMAFFLRFNSERIYTSESQISTGLTMALDFTGQKGRVSPFEMSLNFSNLIANIGSKKVVNRLGFKLLYHDLSNDNPFRTPDFEKAKVKYPNDKELGEILEVLSASIKEFGVINKTNDIGVYIRDLLKVYEYTEPALLENVVINRVGSTDFINIRFSSEVPEMSAYIVNEWALNFIEYYNYQKTGRLNTSLSVLSEILKDKLNSLDENIKELNRYKSRNAFFNSNSETDPVAEYERLIREKESNIRSLNIRLQDIRETISKVDKTSSFNSRKKIISIKNHMDRLSDMLMTDSRNQMLLDSMEYYRKDLQTEMYLHTSSSDDRTELESLFKKENELELQYKIELVDLQQLRGSYNQEKGAVQNLASTKSVLENLETEVEQARKEYLGAQDKYNQARSQLLVGISSIEMSYYGVAPLESESRKTIIFTVLGFMVGFVITLFLILGLEIFDLRIKNPLKFRRTTGFDPNGTISYLPGFEGQLSKVLLGKLPGTKKNVGVEFLQALRKLRFDIQRSPGKTVLFTSLREGAGKSFLLTSLAYSLSLIKKRVLVIDTNFRNNTLSNNMVEKDRKDIDLYGLNIILTKSEVKKYDPTEGDKMDLIKNRIISETANPFVFIMRSQNIKQSPEEFFSKVDFQKYIELFKEQFDYILLEGAALNDYSATKELSIYVDSIVSVFSVKHEFNNKDKKSLKFLKENEEKLGLNILNNVNSDDAE